MRELLRVGIFTEFFFRKYAQPHFIICIFIVNMPTPHLLGVGIFTVKMPFFSGKTAENVMGVYMDLTVLPFFETWIAHIFGGWQRVCWCINEAFNQASPAKEF